MKIRPLPGYVVIEPIEEEAVSKGGVYLPEASKDKPSKGKVVAVGDNIKKWVESGIGDVLDTHVCPVKKGQTVIYKKWTNQEVDHEGNTYLIVKFDELLAVI